MIIGTKKQIMHTKCKIMRIMVEVTPTRRFISKQISQKGKKMDASTLLEEHQDRREVVVYALYTMSVIKIWQSQPLNFRNYACLHSV